MKHRYAATTALLLVMIILPASATQAQTVTTLHTFGTTSNDGRNPIGLQQSGMNIFGTTEYGGSASCGTIFRLHPANEMESTSYAFCSTATDGSVPNPGFARIGPALYGTTEDGGLANHGTVYKLDLPTGTETALYSFTGGTNGSTDGYAPVAGLTQVGGMLYGVANGGMPVGTSGGGTAEYGVAFRIDPSNGAETILHNFGSGDDAAGPITTLVKAEGLLYGLSRSGGYTGGGTVFSIDPQSGAEHVVYAIPFDDRTPESLIVVGRILYGTTSNGGTDDFGTIFKFDPATHSGAIIYSFAGTGSSTYSSHRLMLASNGLLYGLAAPNSGSDGGRYGAIFSFDPASGAEAPVNSFTGGVDGSNPTSLISYNGTIYGTTFGKGDAGCRCGTVLKLTP